MWLFMREGFLSIVQDKDDPDMLLVRGRVRGDIEKYFPDAEVKETPDNDYLFRAFIPRMRVAGEIAVAVNAISYTNYKASVPRNRQLWYGRIWGVMIDLQERIRRKR